MADDTVDDARQRLAYVLSEYIDELADAPPVKAAIDALIAAVRAENAEPERCTNCADFPIKPSDYCDRHRPTIAIPSPPEKR